MLLEFTVENFLSYKEATTFSMVAAKSPKELQGNMFAPELPGMKNVKLLKSAGIYGANASGKTNLIEAVHFLCALVEDSAVRKKPGEEVGVAPFALAPSCRERPSRFEVQFAQDRVPHIYEFAATAERVEYERLEAFPKGKPRLIFERKRDGEDYTWDFGSHVSGAKALTERTRANALFLSVAAQFDLDEVKPAYRWLIDTGQHLVSGKLSTIATTMYLLKDPSLRPRFLKMLQEADLGVVELAFDKKEMPDLEFLEEMPEEDKRRFMDHVGDVLTTEVRLVHQAQGQEPVKLDFHTESRGTQRLFSLLGLLHDVFTRGLCLCMDEIGASMHPMMTRALVRMFHDPKVNPRGAQLIFTTHDTTLLSRDLLRRDQVWFTEKGLDGATTLYPLTDYSPRKGEALERGYLAGRYGAIPMLDEGLSF